MKNGEKVFFDEDLKVQLNDNDFFELLKIQNQRNFGLGVKEGWWEGVDLKRNQPIPFPKEINSSNFNTMSQVFASLGIFKSVSEAKKAGWNKPVEIGEFWFKNRTIRIHII